MNRPTAVLFAVLAGITYIPGSPAGRLPAGSTVGVGTGSATVSLSGSVLCKGAPNTTTATTDEEVLATCSIPANTLTANGDALRVSLHGHTAATANTKQLRIRLGGLTGTVVFDSSALGSNNLQVQTEECQYVRESATTVVGGCLVTYSVEGDNVAVTSAPRSNFVNTPRSADWSTALALVITADTNTASAGLTLDTYSVVIEK